MLPCPHIHKRFQACCLVLAHKDRALYGVNKVVCRGYEIHSFLFWCYKTKVFFVHILVVLFCEDLATLTLYRTAHERS